MSSQTQAPVEDRTACPTALIVVPALIGGLVWLCVIISRLPQ